MEAATSGEQTPWESSSLRGDFYFVAKAEEPPSPAPKPQPETVTDAKPSELTRQQLAARGYEAAERIHTISSYQLVIEQFPGTLYAKLAEEQIKKLKGADKPPAPSTEEVEASLQLDREKRKRIQIGLRTLGFNPGSPDGKFGPNTRSAIQVWQRTNGHAATRYLTRKQAETILSVVPPTAILRPKCAELPGQYLGDNHAECWEEIESRSGCYWWNAHYHSNRTTKWSGQCRNGVAEGHGTFSSPSGSEHSSYERTGTLVNGKELWSVDRRMGRWQQLRGRLARRQADGSGDLHLGRW